jgi:hypothetical protein
MDPILLTITTRFSCHGCGLRDHPCMVRERHGTEDLSGWVDMIRYAVAREHRRVSPACDARTCDLKIPMTGTDRIGGAVFQS